MIGIIDKPFEDIFDLLAALKRMKPALSDPMTQGIQEDPCTLQEVRGADCKKRFIHNKEMLELYRGESQIYDSCRPSLYRLEAGSIEQLLHLIRLEEFKRIVSEHAAVEKLEGDGEFVDYHGLASHYGLVSDTLNLTESLNVAALFACCSFDGETFTPTEAGVGVIYKLLRLALADLKSPRKYEHIGLPPFMRPIKQSAYSFRMLPGEDFATIAVPYYFKQSISASEQMLSDFDQSDVLCPDDPIVNLAKRIKSNRVLSHNAFLNVYKKYKTAVKDPRKIFKKRL